MLRSAASKVMWVGRATVFLVGLAVILAVVFGAASAALGANGQAWILGQSNVATAITSLGGAGGVNGPMVRLTNNDAGTNDTALDLRVQAGEAPMRVNSERRVSNLNADKLDGKNSTQLGINGYELVSVQSSFDSTAHKSETASCPEGKRVIGGGVKVFPSLLDPRRDSAPIVIRYSSPSGFSESWSAIADEVDTYGYSWWVQAIAICATAP
jgi:hypothetical protein